MDNDELYEAAMDAISRLFSDRTVSRSKTKENLKGLQGEIDVFLDALEGDDK